MCEGFSVCFTTHARSRIERWMIEESRVLESLLKVDPVFRKLQEETKNPTEHKWDAYYPYSKKYLLRVVYVVSERLREVRVVTVHKIDIKRQSRITGE